MRRFTLVCDDARAAEIERLAEEYDLSEEDVLRQLIGLGLDTVD
jgi:2-iminoacetate synthase ThiH